MTNRWLSLPLHCFLFALVPLASQLAFNLGQVPAKEAVRSVLIALTATSILLFVAHVWVRNLRHAGLLVSVVNLSFFTYGHLFILFIVGLHSGSSAIALDLEPHDILLAGHLLSLLVLSLFVGMSFWLIRRKQSWWKTGSVYLNLVGVVALVIPLYQIMNFEWQLRMPRPEPAVDAELATAFDGAEPKPVQPDIYYIVLDGYARSDVLRAGYDLDNSPFLSFLQSLDFKEADGSLSNYSQTVLSQASTLNMTYIGHETPRLDATAMDVHTRAELASVIRESRVRQVVEERGYQFISFSTGYGLIEIVDADRFLAPDYRGVNTFESLVIGTSALSVLEEGAALLGYPYQHPGYAAHRERVMFALQTLPDLAQMDGPKFVYAHLVIPHPPFVFSNDGRPINPAHRYTLGDASHSMLGEEEYVDGYRDQVLFVNSELRELLPRLIENSEVEPVILLQADHGPGARLEWEAPTEQAIHERMAILNAYRVPSLDDRSFYPGISPVNSFRLIFNVIFDAEFELLSDRSYFSTVDQPFEFLRVR